MVWWERVDERVRMTSTNASGSDGYGSRLTKVGGREEKRKMRRLSGGRWFV